MTGKERCLSAMRGKTVDRISVHPAIDVCYSAGQYGRSVGECFMDPVLHAKSLDNIFNLHPDIDGLYVNICLSPHTFSCSGQKSGTFYAADSAGMTWAVPDNDVGSVCLRDIKTLSDTRLQTENPLKFGPLETYRAVSPEINKHYLIIPGLTGPYCQMVFLFGLEETIFSMYDSPLDLKKALQWRTDLAIAWADDYIKMNVPSVWIGEGPASGSILSPEAYEEFVLPYTRQVVEYLNSSGITTVMHVCGDIRQSAGRIAQTGANAMDIDYMVDLRNVRKSIGRPVCLRGNLNPLDLQNMTPEELKARCRSILSAGRENNAAFVLSTGCLVTRDTPPENIDAMVSAAKEAATS